MMAESKRHVIHVISLAPIYLLVKPVLGMRLPVEDLSLLEPERNLLLGILNRVRSVANVAADLNAEISTDSSGGRFQGVGSTEHLPSSGNSLLALPNHGNDRAAQHIISKLGKERLVHKVAVVGLKKLLAGHTSLHGAQLVAFRLESGDDVADNTTLDTIGLDLLRVKVNIKKTCKSK